MKKYSINVHYDMVINVEVVADSLEQAKQTAYDQSAGMDIGGAECVGHDECLTDEWELTAEEVRKMENEAVTRTVKEWFASYSDPTDKDEKRALFNVAFGKDLPYWPADISQDTPQWERDLLHILQDGTHPRMAVFERYARLYGLREITRRYGYGRTAKSAFEAHCEGTGKMGRKQAVSDGLRVLCDKMEDYVMNQDNEDCKVYEPQMIVRYDFGRDAHGHDDYWNLFVYCHGPNDGEDASDCYELATAWQHQHYDSDGRDLCDDYATEMHQSRAALLRYLFYQAPQEFDETDERVSHEQMTDVWVDC